MAALGPRVSDTEEPRGAPGAQAEAGDTTRGGGRAGARRETGRSVETRWGFSLEEVYALALKFFKEMNGKAFNPTYEDNLHLVALQKQAALGPCHARARPDVGFLDVLGNDRRRKWAQLGSMTREDAMEDFVELLNSCCGRFSPYVTSHKIEKEEQERQLREEERLRLEKEEQERREEEQRREEERMKTEEPESLLTEHQRQQVLAALDARTGVYFGQYAALQFPDSPEQQARLVLQLRERHYREYVRQVIQQAKPAPNDEPPDGNLLDQSGSSRGRGNETDGGAFPVLAPTTWTRPQVQEFKVKVRRDAESVVTVGRGEVLTVRVPANRDGAFFFWEFATDQYDIAFGLRFEWSGQSGGSQGVTPGVSEVVPLCRLDSHEDVHAGSHQYPGQGVYLLSFDNSYSLWRPKTVYYRVYYTP